MKGNDEVVTFLNEVLTAELTAVNQYFLDGRMLANWGYDVLAEKFKEDSIDEMKDADALIERILYLDAIPNVQRLDPVRTGETPVEKIRLALDVEKAAIERLNRGVALCTEKADHGSRLIVEQILRGEEEHADWLESQLDLVSQLGEQEYLSTQVRS